MKLLLHVLHSLIDEVIFSRAHALLPRVPVPVLPHFINPVVVLHLLAPGETIGGGAETLSDRRHIRQVKP